MIRYHVGDVRAVLADLPDASVDLVLTSPPFLALRSYLPADHPDKGDERGSESTPGEFLDALLDVVVELRRVLTPTGSLVVELGDTYAGSGGAGGDYRAGGWRAGQELFDGSARRGAARVRYDGEPMSIPGRRHYTTPKGGPAWPLDKSLALIPQAFALALAYGVNPHTGRTLDRWRVRNVVRWCRPNPPVGALGDKFRPAVSELVVACTRRDRWFDLDAVREPNPRVHETSDGRARRDHARAEVGLSSAPDVDDRAVPQNEAGAPPLDWWEIPARGYRGAHFATFPEELCVRPIRSMCPTRVCTTCGAPSRRITTVTDEYRAALDQTNGGRGRGDLGDDPNVRPTGGTWILPARESVTLGWSDCGHDTWRRGVVLDPFAGTGTTLAVALGQGRDAIGIDLDPRNAALAHARVGLWFEEVERTRDAG